MIRKKIGHIEGKTEEDERGEFLRLVEPLVQNARSDNIRLQTLSISALVNLCNSSEDVKEIFF